MQKQNKNKIQSSALVSTLILVLLATFVPIFQNEAYAQDQNEELYVHNFFDVPPYGNWTYLEKPISPVYINDSQIKIGSNWTIICPLKANHTYHIYFYGEWVDYGPNPETDYDIYVYNPLGELEGYHTEAAGLPEHLGTTTEEPFFKPKYSGNYTFVIRNDPRESKAAKPATFMIIENIECNKWHEIHVEGKENNRHVENTSWAFEFKTSSQKIEILLKVPETLDMYEVRLYPMANPSEGVGETLNEVPLPWEKGLYGELQNEFGGYNIRSEGYRGVAYASCEYYGQDMQINYTAPFTGETLYHLVLIGEKGSGKIRFIVKTGDLKPALIEKRSQWKIAPNNESTLIFESNCTDITKAWLNYTTNKWKSHNTTQMEMINNRTCLAVIPSQPAGTTIEYIAEAIDTLENKLVSAGNYTIKYAVSINIWLDKESVTEGENITVYGTMQPAEQNLTITITLTSENATIQQETTTDINGNFTLSLKPNIKGEWTIQAVFNGDKYRFKAYSQKLTLKVEEPTFFSKFALYIYGAIIATIVIGAVVYVKKFRE